MHKTFLLEVVVGRERFVQAWVDPDDLHLRMPKQRFDKRQGAESWQSAGQTLCHQFSKNIVVRQFPAGSFKYGLRLITLKFVGMMHAEQAGTVE